MLFALGVRLIHIDWKDWKIGLVGAVVSPLSGLAIALPIGYLLDLPLTTLPIDCVCNANEYNPRLGINCYLFFDHVLIHTSIVHTLCSEVLMKPSLLFLRLIPGRSHVWLRRRPRPSQ